MPEFIVEGGTFEQATRALFEAADRVDELATRRVREIGVVFAGEAKKEASKHSQKIPPTIHTMPIPHGVAVRAGNAKVPLAALYDLGNEGHGGRRRPTFKHPVFGNREVWVDQKRYPFFGPTRKLLRAWIVTQMNEIWDEALRPFLRGGV